MVLAKIRGVHPQSWSKCCDLQFSNWLLQKSIKDRIMCSGFDWEWTCEFKLGSWKEILNLNSECVSFRETYLTINWFHIQKTEIFSLVMTFYIYISPWIFFFFWLLRILCFQPLMYCNLCICVSVYVNRSHRVINQNVDIYLHTRWAMFKHYSVEVG